MSIFRISKGDVESFSIAANPPRVYSSSSSGVTGSIHVYPRRSHIDKDFSTASSFIDSTHDDADVNVFLEDLQVLAKAQPISSSITDDIEKYLTIVNSQQESQRRKVVLDVNRFTPSYTYTSDTMRKLLVKDILNSYYRLQYPTAHWAYTNYNCLNFFTASTVPSDSVLLYPNVVLPTDPTHDGYNEGTFTPSGSFSFDFYIKPRYQNGAELDFRAGTILHLSSCYALSLCSGSEKNANNQATCFKLKLQLKHSADVPPSLATINSTYPADLVFESDDNSLKLNRWHHVVVRWGTNMYNNGSGSFNIDGLDKGIFVVPSGTVASTINEDSPDVLCVGNYYEGANSGNDALAYFFAYDPALRDGLSRLLDDTGVDQPDTFAFTHPLNAEIHDLAIRRKYVTDDDIGNSGPSSVDDTYAFYLPPFFVEETPVRRFVGDHGGVMQTPFFAIDGSTNDPFNVAMSFGVAGHYINTENFLRDFASNTYPRQHHLTGVEISTTTDVRSANEFLYEQPFVRKRNLLILPCDDGNFTPNYNLLSSESVLRFAVNDYGVRDISLINLDNMISTASLVFGDVLSASYDDGSRTTTHDQMLNQMLGFSPEQPWQRPGPAFVSYQKMIEDSIVADTFDAGVQDNAPLTIYHRTGDASSNQVTFFDFSNLYYGTQIMPKSFVLTDTDISGSGGAVSITLKDDGAGNLYRADCVTSASMWNSVGNIYYNEGIVAIKSPHLYFFGQHQYDMSFRASHNVHVATYNVIIPANTLNSSSNPTYKVLPPSEYANDPENSFVYLTGINFHDANMNVVMKTQLAQPLVKRQGEKYLIRCKLDY